MSPEPPRPPRSSTENYRRLAARGDRNAAEALVRRLVNAVMSECQKTASATRPPLLRLQKMLEVNGPLRYIHLSP